MKKNQLWTIAAVLLAISIIVIGCPTEAKDPETTTTTERIDVLGTPVTYTELKAKLAAGETGTFALVGPLAATGASDSIPADVTVNAYVNISVGAAFTVDGTLNITKGVSLSGITNTYKLTVNDGGIVNIADGATLGVDQIANATTDGSILATYIGELEKTGGATNSLSKGTVTIGSGAWISTPKAALANAYLTEVGSFIVSDTVTQSSGLPNHTSAVTVKLGAGANTMDGALEIPANVTLIVPTGGTITTGARTLTVTGALTLDGGTLTVAGGNAVGSVALVDGTGTLTVGKGGTLTVTGGESANVSAGGAATVSASVVVDGGTVAVTGGDGCGSGAHVGGVALIDGAVTVRSDSIIGVTGGGSTSNANGGAATIGVTGSPANKLTVSTGSTNIDLTVTGGSYTGGNQGGTATVFTAHNLGVSGTSALAGTENPAPITGVTLITSGETYNYAGDSGSTIVVTGNDS
ncbi:hypothetical protein FACS1894110_02550 [Spirochaetia bacterium]|nr:hypothetical protein FACS1894110_02550 [Spirochaetia bacterium]